VKKREVIRPFKKKVPKQKFLIVCNAKQTEPNYFKAFPVKSVRTAEKAVDPISLVQYTVKLKKDYLDNGMKFDQVWCVFDKDDCLPSAFNDAIKIAKNKKINVAYSNEAFELWYLLHYDFMQSAITRDSYIAKLNKKPEINGMYKKNDKDMYRKLLDRQQTAINHATSLLALYNPINPTQNNPSTTVHHLVVELNKNKFL
jgi:hypothetical protein